MDLLPAERWTPVTNQRKKHAPRKFVGRIVGWVIAAIMVGTGQHGESSAPADSLARGLVAHWNFDDDQGDAVHDAASGANHATLEGGAMRSERPRGHAVSFDGKQSRVWVDSPRALDLPAEMSAFAWIRCDNVAAGAYGECIYGQTTSGGNGGQYELCVGRGKNLQEVTVLWRDVDVCVSRAKLKAGEWRHIGFTRTGRPGDWTCTIYIDGTANSVAEKISTDPGPALPFALGRAGAYDGLYFHGAIDDFRIYGRALTPDEVKALFDAADNRAAK